MGRDKALLAWPPQVSVESWRDTFLGAAIERLQAVCELVIVVVGTNSETLAPFVYSSSADALVVNPDPQRGQFSSLRIGLQEVLNQGRDAAFVALVDRPPASESTYESLRQEFLETSSDCLAVVPEYSGKHGHPIVIGREMIEAMLRAPADSNAREVMHAHQERITYFTVNDPFVTMNINTAEDYERLLRTTHPTYKDESRKMNKGTLEPAAQEFTEHVLATRPAIAVFDCDGTLWSGDSGADFFYWEIEQELIPKAVADAALARYDLYNRGQVDEATMCGEMVQIHAGLSERVIREAAEKFFTEVVEHRLFPEMRLLTQELAKAGCELWAVSSTNNWVVEEGARRFGIPAERVLAACIEFDCEFASDRLIRIPSGDDKAVAIREVIGRPVDGVFGNSIHDLAMLQIAKHPWVVNPNDDLEEIAVERGWEIYWPIGTRGARAAK
jgi:CTP:molybdopterin cytidylyltransferase MocA/phosphoserine phosphatase